MKIRLTVILWSLLGLVAYPVLGAEGRIPIYQPGTIVTAPGRYIVTQSLVGTGAAAVIEVNGNGIDIDLNGFDLDNGLGPKPVILISNGDAVIHDGSLLRGGQGIDTVNGYPLVFRNLHITNSVGDGIRGGTAVTIEHVNIETPGANGIHLLTGSANNVIRDVAIRYAAGEGIRFENVLNSRITDCNIYFVVGPIIELASSSGNIRVESNTVGNGASDGILLSAASGALVAHNVVGCAGNGISVVGGSSFAAIRDNVILNAGGEGIRIHALGCSVERNQVTNSGSVGIHFISGSHANSYGRNSLLRNTGFGGCTGTYIAPDFCNDGSAADNVSFGDNLTTGGPLF